MMKLHIGIAAVFLITAASASAEEVSGWDRFQLWNECRPTQLVVEEMHKDAGDIGLTKRAIEVAVRSRLRGARLFTEDYNDSALSYLYVNVNVVGLGYSLSVEYKKLVEDPVSGQRGNAATWDVGGTGTHGKDSNFILSHVEQYADSFIDEYLRVNADAC